MPYSVTTYKRPKPFLKWAGGKGQLIKQYRHLFPANFEAFHEPFLGGGAIFFDILPENAYLSDLNEELINAYVVVRDCVEDLIKDLSKHVNDKAYYYKIRKLDPSDLTPVERASRLIFFNKTGYNGLYRVNNQGQFNVPFGKYENPKFCDPDNVRILG